MQDLDDLFAIAAAQNAALVPPDGLMARVLADAAREQQRIPAKPPAAPAPAPAQFGVWSALSSLFGGGQVLASLGTAAVAGLYLGFAQPGALLQLTDALSGTSGLESVDLMPDVDALLSEDW